MSRYSLEQARKRFSSRSSTPAYSCADCAEEPEIGVIPNPVRNNAIFIQIVPEAARLHRRLEIFHEIADELIMPQQRRHICDARAQGVVIGEDERTVRGPISGCFVSQTFAPNALCRMPPTWTNSLIFGSTLYP